MSMPTNSVHRLDTGTFVCMYISVGMVLGLALFAPACSAAASETAGAAAAGAGPVAGGARQVGLGTLFEGTRLDGFLASAPPTSTGANPTGVERPADGRMTDAGRRRADLPTILAAARAFLRRRPDVATRIPQWCGEQNPIGILAHWLRITHERNGDTEAARRILRQLDPASFLDLRPDIRDSVAASTGQREPRQVIATWLQWNTTETGIYPEIARQVLGLAPIPAANDQPPAAGAPTTAPVPRPAPAPAPTPTPDSSPNPGPTPTAPEPEVRPPSTPTTPAHPAAPAATPPVVGDARFQLANLPRPRDDSGWGIHWFPTLGSSDDVIARYLDECEAMGVRWVVFLNEAEKISTANDRLIAGLRERGMMPVLRLYSRTVPLDHARMAAVVRHNVARGVFYFQLYNEPNLRCEWDDGRIDLARFVDLWIEGADTILAAGGFPAFAPLCGKGDDGRDDLAFLEACLDRLAACGRLDLLKNCWVAIHNQTWQPVDHVADATGFRKYRFYDAILRRRLGESRPVIATEGGFQTGGNPAENARHRDWHLAAYDAMLTAEPYFLAQCNWILGNDVGGGTAGMWEDATWFKPGGELPVVAALKARPKERRRR